MGTKELKNLLHVHAGLFQPQDKSGVDLLNRPTIDNARPLPSLPSEILTIIIRYAAAPRGTQYFAANQQFQSCSLVARSWRGPAQAELFRHVELRDAKGAMMFLRTATDETHDGQSLTNRTLSLRLLPDLQFAHLEGPDGPHADIDARDITSSLLSYCPYLKHLSIVGLPVNPWSLDGAKGLETLHLIQVDLTPRFDTDITSQLWTFPHLRQLTIDAVICGNEFDDCDEWDDGVNFYTPSSFPSLECFVFTGDNMERWDHPDLSAIAPNLRAFHHYRPEEASGQNYASCANELKDYSQLQEFAMRFEDIIELECFDALPTSLKTLRVDDADNLLSMFELEWRVMEIVGKLLERNGSSLMTLSNPIVEDSEEAMIMRKITRAKGKELKIELREEDYASFVGGEQSVRKTWEQCLRDEL